MSDFFDFSGSLEFFIRFFINISAVYALVMMVYYKSERDKTYVFSFMLFNIIIFFISWMMLKVNISIGVAFGLFAIFGILRYRTETIPILEMTYLLSVIAVALVNSLGNFNVLIIVINAVIILTTFIMESLWFRESLESITLKIDRIDLASADKNRELIDALKEMTGLDIEKASIKSSNYIQGTLDVRAYYRKTRS